MKKDTKRAEILKAASHVFRAKGYHATRIQDIADALGMQKGSLYYYIETKEDLLRGLVDEVLAESVELLNHINSTGFTPEEKMRMCIESHLKLYHNNVEAFGVFLRENMDLLRKTSDKDIFGLIRDYENGWMRIFEEGVERGEFNPDLDYKIVVKGLFGMLNWSYRWYSPKTGYSLEEVADIFTQMILGGVSIRNRTEFVPVSVMSAFK